MWVRFRRYRIDASADRRMRWHWSEFGRTVCGHTVHAYDWSQGHADPPERNRCRTCVRLQKQHEVSP